MAVFLATDLTRNPLAPDADEFLQVEKIPAGRPLKWRSKANCWMQKLWLPCF